MPFAIRKNLSARDAFTFLPFGRCARFLHVSSSVSTSLVFFSLACACMAHGTFEFAFVCIIWCIFVWYTRAFIPHAHTHTRQSANLHAFHKQNFWFDILFFALSGPRCVPFPTKNCDLHARSRYKPFKWYLWLWIQLALWCLSLMLRMFTTFEQNKKKAKTKHGKEWTTENKKTYKKIKSAQTYARIELKRWIKATQIYTQNKTQPKQRRSKRQTAKIVHTFSCETERESEKRTETMTES